MLSIFDVNYYKPFYFLNMKKIFFLICCLTIMISSCSDKTDNAPTEHRRSAITQIGAIGYEHVLIMANGDTLISMSNAVSSAQPKDTAVYSKTEKGWRIMIIYSEHHKIEDNRKEVKHNAVPVPVVVPVSH